ncbi:MAG: hypothetical protein ACMX3H_12270 [Sodalis sp. (in: enterobacteria)]|uniref:hypothetical protein n=1 Tax=Sodalis sp. (in: enterobacteria) TaxID=1898979 RepID=UPI0039E23861
MDEAQLLQVMCAFRLLAPEVEISLSTRESAHFRDHAVPIMVNSVSAGSKTQPGAYVMPAIGRSWNNFCLTITARPKRWRRSLSARGCSRCGKTGIRIWDARPSSFERGVKKTAPEGAVLASPAARDNADNQSSLPLRPAFSSSARLAEASSAVICGAAGASPC